MQPCMSAKEFDLFLAFIRKCRHYAEFGAGGSTYVASQHVAESIVSLDSSVEWLENVQTACAGHKVQPKLIHIDIGPIGEWGYPTDPKTRNSWPAYHEAMFAVHSPEQTDLYMVDGRFRVACFAQTVLHARKDALIMIHDFSSRPHYHGVREIAREIACAEDLSVFMPLPGVEERARNLLEAHKFTAA